MNNIFFYLIFSPGLIIGQLNFMPSYASQSFYDSGHILSLVEYKSGIRNGKCIYYYENGQIQSESLYKNGKLTGEYKSYYQSGELRELGQYKFVEKNIYSRKEGVWRTFIKMVKLNTNRFSKTTKLYQVNLLTKMETLPLLMKGVSSFMRVEVFAVKGTPIWFFTPYVFELEIKLYTTLDKETLYKSSDLIFQDKLAIEKLLILEYTELNREILNKEMQLKFKIDSFEFCVI